MNILRNYLNYLIYLSLLFLFACTSNKEIQSLHVMTSGGFASSHQSLVPEFTKQTRIEIKTSLGSSMGASITSIPNRLSRGESADIVILAKNALDTLTKQGFIEEDSQIDLVSSAIGMAIKKGSQIPEIKTKEQLKQVLLNAENIAYSASASGTYYESEMLHKLNIYEKTIHKSKKIVTERVGHVIARGEAEIGFQQVSELLPIEGIIFVGKIPEDIQKYTVFSAGILKSSKNKKLAKQLLDFYKSEYSENIINNQGLELVK